MSTSSTTQIAPIRTVKGNRHRLAFSTVRLSVVLSKYVLNMEDARSGLFLLTTLYLLFLKIFINVFKLQMYSDFFKAYIMYCASFLFTFTYSRLIPGVKY